jgi:hypothetical protein
MPGEELLRKIALAVARAVDEGKLARELAGLGGDASAGEAGGSQADSKLRERLQCVDILDDAILSAQAGDKTYPLRLFFGALGERLVEDDAAFALANALNVFFRVEMEEEVKMRLGLEASRLYYRFALSAGAGLDRDLVPQLSSLLAALLSNDVERVRFEAVDHARIFDSALHEREAGADGASSQIKEPRSFLCRVVATNMVRARALVKT